MMRCISQEYLKLIIRILQKTYNLNSYPKPQLHPESSSKPVGGREKKASTAKLQGIDARGSDGVVIVAYLRPNVPDTVMRSKNLNLQPAIGACHAKL